MAPPGLPLDTVQDIQFARDSTAVIAFWSGRVDLVSVAEGELAHRALQLESPAECTPPGGRSVVYSAFLHRGSVYATLFCGATILAERVEWR